MDRPSNALVRFYRLIEQGRPPQRADRSAGGTLPTRAYRYCEAVASASAFGWWVFLPADLMLFWDGTTIFWRCTGTTDWFPLQSAVQFPRLMNKFNAAAPETLQGCAPPYLTALPEPGALQIWTGLMARTAPEWHLLVRAPSNVPSAGGYSLYEGIVATDRWFGPLFTNLRLTRTNVPVQISSDLPFLLVQPLQHAAYSQQLLSSMEVRDGFGALQESDWTEYHKGIVVPNDHPDRPLGAYAVAERKRQPVFKCPIHVDPNAGDGHIARLTPA